MENRKEAIKKLSQYLRRYGRPRTQLFLILLITAAVGAGLSFVFLKLGLVHMGLRYPAAAFLAYLAFLVILRFWAQRQLSRPELTPELGLHEKEPEEIKSKPRRIFSPLDLFDIFNIVDAGVEGLLILAGGIVIVTLVGIIIAAPLLLAEVLLDGLLVAGLWNRLIHQASSDSQKGVFRATWLPAAVVIIGLGAIGYLLERIEPTAKSIGDLIRF